MQHEDSIDPNGSWTTVTKKKKKTCQSKQVACEEPAFFEDDEFVPTPLFYKSKTVNR